MAKNLATLLQEGLPRQGVELLQRAAEVAARLEYSLHLVGGPVRDLLLGAPTVDLDIAVKGDGQKMAEALAQAEGGKVMARSQFGTARVQAGGLVLDVATARRECYPQPGALPVVVPGTVEEDLFRRDFTINAMAVTLMPAQWGDLVDPFGGERDLEVRQLRVLHNKSFQDDPTRMVRGVRYGQRLGFRLEAQTEFLLRRDSSFLQAVSGPRRWKELQRLLEEIEPEKALLWAQSLGLLPHLHHALHGDRWLAETLEAARQEVETPAVLATVYLCLLAYRLSRQERAELIADFQLPASKAKAVAHLNDLQELFPPLSEPEIMPSTAVRLLDGLSTAAIQACAVAAEQPVLQQTLRDYLTRWRSVKPLLSGEDVARLGVPPGPAIGECLATLRAARLDGRSITKEAEVALVQTWLADQHNVNP